MRATDFSDPSRVHRPCNVPHGTLADEREALAHLRRAAMVAGMEAAEVALPAAHHVVVGRQRLHYLDWGNVGAAPIVFLHGGGLNAHTWDLVCIALRREYRCLALDQRGHGDSEWSPEADYRIEAHLADIEGLVDHLGLERFVAVGMSMGAINSLAFAALRPQRLTALVLIDAGPDVQVAGATRIADFVRETATVASLEAFVARAQAFNPRRDPQLLLRSALHALRRKPDGTWVRKSDPRHLDSLGGVEQVAARIRELWANVPDIPCPTLVVRGADSDVFSDDDAAELAARLPCGQWVKIDGAGHTVQGDNPAGLAAAVRSFLAEMSAAAPTP